LIETLRIENVAILTRGELEFGPGLNVLTGETGAGKSIVLGSLALLAGARFSTDVIREGSDAARVEAVFLTQDVPDLERELSERGFETENHELIVQRSVAREGRGRARLSGQLVPVGTLTELFRGRIEISSQHDSQALLRADEHGLLLDRMGDLLESRETVARLYEQLRTLDKEFARLVTAARERERRQDILSFQLAEIDEAELDPEAFAELEADRARLVHAGRLQQESAEALAQLMGDPLADDARGAADALERARRLLEELERLDPRLDGWGGRLADLASEVREAGLDLERYLAGIEADPARLSDLDERLGEVERLKRKYGASVEEVLRFRDEAASELASIGAADQRETTLRQERDATAARLLEAAMSLSAARKKAGKRLGREVQQRLRDLGMLHARFEVALVPAPVAEGLPCGPGGLETPEFRFSANAGESLRSFRKVASGGELSRAFLAIKGALRGSGGGMVLVFDELDAGVGGEAADRIGRSLAELAAHHQVLCITHLPQVASFAHRHFKVEKTTRKGRTEASIRRVEGDERIREIARMAGGTEIGEATLAHARELVAARSPQA